MSNATPHLAYRPDVDGLRAIAVLAVVVFHAFPAALPGGFVGVDIFFVISGFLISSIILKALDGGGFRFADFYARRIRRIFPVLLLVVLGSLLLGWGVLLPGEYAQLGKHALAGLGFVANFAFWQETGYFDTAAELKPLLHLWSLGVEEQFYIVWPAVLVLAWRLRLNLVAVSAALAASSLAVCIVMTPLAPAASYFLPFARAWELLAGVLLALRVWRRGAVFAAVPRWLPELAAAAGLALIAVALAVVDRTRAFPGAWALLPVGGAVLLIAAGTQSWIGRRVLAHPLLVAIGLISFPLYLWHWPLLAFVRIVQGEQAGAAALGLAVAAAVLLAALSYRAVETPVRRHGGRWAVAGLVAACVVVGAQGWSTYSRDGLAFRLKDAQAREESAALEWSDALRGDDACRGLLAADLAGKCLIAQPGQPPEVMLIGDSHANHYYWGLSTELQALGLNLLQVAEGGCPLLEGFDLYQRGESAGCARIAQAAFDYAVNTPSVHTVLLGGRWVAAITGRQLAGRGDDDKGVVPVLLEDGRARTVAREEAVLEGLARTLARLRAAGKQVVVLESVPELAFNARECIAWTPNSFIRRVPRPGCEVERALIEARNREYRPQFAAVLARHPEVRVFDPMAAMCDERACYGKRDGVLLYRDDDHLSLEGSRWLARQMRAELPTLVAAGTARGETLATAGALREGME